MSVESLTVLTAFDFTTKKFSKLDFTHSIYWQPFLLSLIKYSSLRFEVVVNNTSPPHSLFV